MYQDPTYQEFVNICLGDGLRKVLRSWGLMGRNQLSRLMVLMFNSKFTTGVELQILWLLMLMLILNWLQVYSHVQELVYLLLSIIIGDGEKLKHQHHCKEAESAEAEA